MTGSAPPAERKVTGIRTGTTLCGNASWNPKFHRATSGEEGLIMYIGIGTVVLIIIIVVVILMLRR
jgi:hypothetical protein